MDSRTCRAWSVEKTSNSVSGHLTAVWDCLTSKNETLCQFLYLFILHSSTPDYLLESVKICIEVTLCSWHAVQIQEVTHLSKGSDQKMSSFWIRKHSPQHLFLFLLWGELCGCCSDGEFIHCSTLQYCWYSGLFVWRYVGEGLWLLFDPCDHKPVPAFHSADS